jgi:MFS family permease
MVTIGIVEGIAEATTAITKIFSGAVSDWVGKRKILVVIGYGLAAITKPMFPLAGSIGWVLGARFVDRVGKGIRGAPRDALVADITPAHLRGAAYGLRQSLDAVGAFIGPLLATVFMAWLGGDIRSVLWVAVLPAFVAVAVVVTAVHEPAHVRGERGRRTRLTAADVKRLPVQYWIVVLLGAIFTLARFSEAFLVLRAHDVGLAAGYVPMVLVAMNIVYAASSYPAGSIADRLGARRLLVTGLATLVVADLVLAAASSHLAAFVGAALWGLHMGLTQGLLAKLVADAAPAELRGTAFGVFNLVSGGVLLVASLLAGALWSAFGPPATFMAGAVFAALAALLLAGDRLHADA